MEHSTIAAIATAPGAGGIAVVRLSGAESYRVAARVFRPANPKKSVEAAKGYTALFGHFMEGEEAFDEGVALFFRTPHSYTGEDVVELSCHGGSAVARRLVESCIAAGAAPAAPGEYTRRAFLNGKLGLTQAEAVMDLISADGRQGAALANASLNGALAKKIGAEKDALTALQAHLTAWVDFPEEDVPALEDAQLVSTLTAVKGELDTLIRNYDAGAVLREGVDCAIVGRPNAGKSTLLNLLAGFDRAIVTPVAGTTRDVVEQAVRLGDIRLNLFDTAGLRETEDAIEAEGIRRSWKKLDEAGLILAVFDGSEPLTREDLALAQRCAGRPAIALVNKEDKPTQFDAEIIAGDFAMVLPVCCQEEGSRRVIAAAVARLLGTNNIDPHAASLSGQRQLAAATRGMQWPVRWMRSAAGSGWMPYRSVWTMRWMPSVTSPVKMRRRMSSMKCLSGSVWGSNKFKPLRLSSFASSPSRGALGIKIKFSILRGSILHESSWRLRCDRNRRGPRWH